MRYLFIDFETRSEVDVQTVGTHAYASHPSTSVVLVSWVLDKDTNVRVDTEVTPELYELIESNDVMKIAHNAEFDMAVCKYVLGIDITESDWYDTAYAAAYFGYPRALANLSNILGTARKASPEEMLLFARPKSLARKADPSILFDEDAPTMWNERDEFPEEWARFVEYSRTDTAVLRECFHKLPFLPETEIRVMQMTFEMNFTGVPFDMGLAYGIKRKADEWALEAGEEALREFGIKNLRSTPQVRDALAKNGVYLDSLNAKTRGGVTHKILELRDRATGTAFAKVKTATNRICSDGRLRGEFVGYGTHTGRWSSRGVQLQNFARIKSEVSTDLTKVRDYDHLRQHLRLCIHAPQPYKFVCADLSQIEARVTAWLAGCEWRMKAFANGEDIYARSAERMFNIPKVDKSMPERQMGKCAELGLGFGGGSGAIERIAPDFYFVQGKERVDDIVRRWRNANPEICALWYTLQNALRESTKRGVCRVKCGGAYLTFKYDGCNACIVLPSGRALFYRNLRTDPMGNSFSYSDYSKNGEFPTTEYVWGGVLTENVVQAIARDVIVDIMLRCRELSTFEDLTLIGTVHDEVWYLSCNENALNILLAQMSEPISWADGLVTCGDGFIYERYIK